MSDFTNDPDPRTEAPEAGESASPAAAAGVFRSQSAPVGTETGSRPSESVSTVDRPVADGAEPPVAPSEPARHVTVELAEAEARVLGSLIEKSFLTPDVYPMTTNSLVTASNQKTNRDPVLSLSAVDVDGALLAMRQRNLVRRVHAPGSRSSKHRQTLDEVLMLNERQTALLSVLLLRGPQTIGELRLRTERHDVGFDDLEAVEGCLEGLAGRALPLVVQLARQPGHKEARWQHLLSDPDGATADPDPGHADAAELGPGTVTATVRAASPAQLETAAVAPQASATADGRVQALEEQVDTLRRQLASLADQLGVTLD